MLKYILLLFFSTFFTVTSIFAKDNNLGDTIIIRDFSSDFLVYDDDFLTYVPYTDGDVTSKSLYSNLDSYKEYYLFFESKPGLTLFWNHRLLYENTQGEPKSELIKVDSLLTGVSGKGLVTFFHEQRSLPETFSIVHKGDTSLSYTKGSWQKRDEIAEASDSKFILFFVILFLAAILKNRYFRMVSGIFGFSSSYSLEENYGTSGFLGIPAMLVVLFNSLGFTYILASVSEEVILIINWLDYLIWIAVFFGLFYLKLFFLEAVGAIFGIRGIAREHFAELLKISTVTNTLLIPVISIMNFSELLDVQFSYMAFLVILVLVLIIGMIKLLVLTFRVNQFNYIYLFSYLCIAEIIPLAFVIKITLLSNLSL